MCERSRACGDRRAGSVHRTIFCYGCEVPAPVPNSGRHSWQRDGRTDFWPPTDSSATQAPSQLVQMVFPTKRLALEIRLRVFTRPELARLKFGLVHR